MDSAHILDPTMITHALIVPSVCSVQVKIDLVSESQNEMEELKGARAAVHGGLSTADAPHQNKPPPRPHRRKLHVLPPSGQVYRGEPGVPRTAPSQPPASITERGVRR